MSSENANESSMHLLAAAAHDKDLEKRASGVVGLLLDNKTKTTKDEQSSTDTEEDEHHPKPKEKASKQKKRKVEGSDREKAAEERKKLKREEKIAIQNKMAAEERERRRRKEEVRRAQKQAVEEKLAGRKKKCKTDKDANEEKNAASVAAAQLKADDDDTQIDKKPKATRGGSEVTDNDVLLGRGGMTNQHVGNKRFRDLVLAMQPTYINQRSRAKKSEMSRTIVAQVKALGGRFLKEVDGKYQEVSEDVAQKKASQALRENAKDLRKIQNEKGSPANDGSAKSASSGVNGKSAVKGTK